MTNKLGTLSLSVLIGMCAPNRLLPQVASPKDTPQVTTAGVTFAAPAGWSVSPSGSAISVVAPEADTHVVVLDEKSPDAATAVRASMGHLQTRLHEAVTNLR